MVCRLKPAQQRAFDFVAQPQQDLDVDRQVGHRHCGQVVGGPGAQRPVSWASFPSNVVSNMCSNVVEPTNEYQL